MFTNSHLQALISVMIRRGLNNNNKTKSNNIKKQNENNSNHSPFIAVYWITLGDLGMGLN